MKQQRKITAGVLTTVGFLLSPLSWWNDAFVNLPLALAFAWAAAALVPVAWHDQVFEFALVIGYWLTNVLGFVLMHRGIALLISPEERRSARRELARDILISLGYTAVIVLLVKVGLLKPLHDYLR